MTIGIVVPAFNEESRWNLPYWQHVLADTAYEFLFVDDGSTDNTRNVVASLVDELGGRVLSLDENRGKGEAVRLGLLDLLASNEYLGVGFLDADGAFGVSDVSGLAEVFSRRVVDGDFNAVWASRVALAGRDIRRSASRHYLGRAMATVLSAGFDQFPYDTQAGFKVFSAGDPLRACLATPFATRWLFEIELMTRWAKLTGMPLRIWEQPVYRWHDIAGSKVRGRELIRVPKEVAILKRLQIRTRRPSA